MAGASIEEILHYENMIKVILAVKGGVPGGILPEGMFRPTSRMVGNVGTYTKVESTRRVAQTVMYGSPSKAVSLKGVSKVPVTCIHTFEHFQHEPILLALLKSLDGKTQERGAEIVGQKIRDFGQRFENLRRAAWYSALANGKIWLDAEGNLLPTAADAVITIDFGIPTGNKNQLDWDGNGAIIDTTWATDTTNIANDIAELIIAGLTLTGYRLTTAYYGQNIPGYLANNKVMKEFLKLNPGANAAILKGGVPNGFLNLNWVNASYAFFEDSKGVNRFFWKDDMVVFTPDVADVGWWNFLEGSYEIPTDLGVVAGDAAAALRALRQVFGTFAYATITHDPVGIKQYGGDTFLPVVSVPKAVFIADVVP